MVQLIPAGGADNDDNGLPRVPSEICWLRYDLLGHKMSKNDGKYSKRRGEPKPSQTHI